MAITRTYVVGNDSTVRRLDNHIGPWIDVSPTFNTEWNIEDVMADSQDPDKLTVVGNYIGIPGTGILVSTDAGVTWNIPTGTWNDKQKEFREVWYVDSNTIWAVAVDGNVVRSLDGGLTFNSLAQIEPLSPESDATNCIHAISANIAVVGGSLYGTVTDTTAFVWKTIDGGGTWVRLNGGVSLSNAINPVGAPEGIWISSDEQRIIVGTGYTQQLSIDGGVTFNNITPEMTRSGRHLTWYPVYDPPINFRHVGGLPTQIQESTTTGTVWNTIKSASTELIVGAHFYTTNDGYYLDRIVVGSVYVTTDGGATGILSDTAPTTLNAVWTAEDEGTGNLPCGCPEDYVLNPVTGLCEITNTVPAICNGPTYTVYNGSPQFSYGSNGTRFYDDSTGLPLPLSANFTIQEIEDATSTILPLDSLVIGSFAIPNQLWGGLPGHTGRLRDIGVWTQPPTLSNPTPVNEWVGFTYCIDVPVDGIYLVGIGADNGCRFAVDGVPYLELPPSSSNLFVYTYWHVVPITLTAGTHVITLEGWNNAGPASFAAEIYDAPGATAAAKVAYMAALTLPTDPNFISTLLFSTGTLIGQTFDLGEESGCDCPDGYIVSNCGGPLECIQFDSVAPLPCPCYLATDCENPANTIQFTIDPLDPPLDPSLTYTFVSQPDICWTIEISNPLDCVGGEPVFIIENSYATCQDCTTNPAVICWDLEVVCDGPCDDEMSIQTAFDLTPYIGLNISIAPPFSTDPECWYTPFPVRQAIWVNPFLSSVFSDGGANNNFQLGNDDYTFSMPSFILNGVEQIVGSPPTFIMNPANYNAVNCQGLICTPVPYATTENTYSGLADFVNSVLISLGIGYMEAFPSDPSLCPISIIKPQESWRMRYRDGDTFSMTISIAHLPSPFNLTGITEFIYQVQAGNLSVATNIDGAPPFIPGTDYAGCNDNIWCSSTDADIHIITSVFEEGPCPGPELGEACEIVPRLGEPGFSTKNCDPKKVIDVKCKFADSVYAQFKRARYGIDTCCEYDLDKIDIKNQLIDLGFIYDPDLCVDGNIINDDCCLQPCNAVAVLTIPSALLCPAPIDAIADLTIPDPPFAACIEVSFSINPNASADIQPLITGTDCCGELFEIVIEPNVAGAIGTVLCVDANQPYTLADNVILKPTGNDCDCCIAPLNLAGNIKPTRGTVTIPGSNCRLIEFAGINDIDNTIVGTECDGTPINTAVFPGAIPLVLCVDLDLPYAVGNNVQPTSLGICS